MDKSSVEDVVKRNVDQNPQKLRQIGLNYDIAHAKGGFDEQKAENKKKEAGEKKREAKMEKEKEKQEKARIPRLLKKARATLRVKGTTNLPKVRPSLVKNLAGRNHQARGMR